MALNQQSLETFFNNILIGDDKEPDIDKIRWVSALTKLSINLTDSDKLKIFNYIDEEQTGYVDRFDFMDFCNQKNFNNYKDMKTLHNIFITSIKSYLRFLKILNDDSIQIIYDTFTINPGTKFNANNKHDPYYNYYYDDDIFHDFDIEQLENDNIKNCLCCTHCAKQFELYIPFIEHEKKCKIDPEKLIAYILNANEEDKDISFLNKTDYKNDDIPPPPPIRYNNNEMADILSSIPDKIVIWSRLLLNEKDNCRLNQIESQSKYIKCIKLSAYKDYKDIIQTSMVDLILSNEMLSIKHPKHNTSQSTTFDFSRSSPSLHKINNNKKGNKQIITRQKSGSLGIKPDNYTSNSNSNDNNYKLTVGSLAPIPQQISITNASTSILQHLKPNQINTIQTSKIKYSHNLSPINVGKIKLQESTTELTENDDNNLYNKRIKLEESDVDDYDAIIALSPGHSPYVSSLSIHQDVFHQVIIPQDNDNDDKKVINQKDKYNDKYNVPVDAIVTMFNNKNRNSLQLPKAMSPRLNRKITFGSQADVDNDDDDDDGDGSSISSLDNNNTLNDIKHKLDALGTTLTVTINHDRKASSAGIADEELSSSSLPSIKSPDDDDNKDLNDHLWDDMDFNMNSSLLSPINPLSKMNPLSPASSSQFKSIDSGHYEGIIHLILEFSGMSTAIYIDGYLMIHQMIYDLYNKYYNDIWYKYRLPIWLKLLFDKKRLNKLREYYTQNNIKSNNIENGKLKWIYCLHDMICYDHELFTHLIHYYGIPPPLRQLIWYHLSHNNHVITDLDMFESNLTWNSSDVPIIDNIFDVILGYHYKDNVEFILMKSYVFQPFFHHCSMPSDIIRIMISKNKKKLLPNLYYPQYRYIFYYNILQILLQLLWNELPLECQKIIFKYWIDIEQQTNGNNEWLFGNNFKINQILSVYNKKYSNCFDWIMSIYLWDGYLGIAILLTSVILIAIHSKQTIKQLYKKPFIETHIDKLKNVYKYIYQYIVYNHDSDCYQLSLNVIKQLCNLPV